MKTRVSLAVAAIAASLAGCATTAESPQAGTSAAPQISTAAPSLGGAASAVWLWSLLF
jgi:hypothetical protein